MVLYLRIKDQYNNVLNIFHSFWVILSNRITESSKIITPQIRWNLVPELLWNLAEEERNAEEERQRLILEAAAEAEREKRKAEREAQNIQAAQQAEAQAAKEQEEQQPQKEQEQQQQQQGKEGKIPPPFSDDTGITDDDVLDQPEIVVPREILDGAYRKALDSRLATIPPLPQVPNETEENVLTFFDIREIHPIQINMDADFSNVSLSNIVSRRLTSYQEEGKISTIAKIKMLLDLFFTIAHFCYVLLQMWLKCSVVYMYIYSYDVAVVWMSDKILLEALGSFLFSLLVTDADWVLCCLYISIHVHCELACVTGIQFVTLQLCIGPHIYWGLFTYSHSMFIPAPFWSRS